jgi:hypothetical protein
LSIGGIHCDIYICTYILITFVPSITCSHPPSFLRTMSAGFIVLFSYTNTSTSTIFILLHPLLKPSPFSLGTHPQTGPVVPSCPTFLKNVYVDSSRGFALVFQTCLYCALIRSSSYYSLFFYHSFL